jgi:hypothetical protein
VGFVVDIVETWHVFLRIFPFLLPILIPVNDSLSLIIIDDIHIVWGAILSKQSEFPSSVASPQNIPLPITLPLLLPNTLPSVQGMSYLYQKDERELPWKLLRK